MALIAKIQIAPSSQRSPQSDGLSKQHGAGESPVVVCTQYRAGLAELKDKYAIKSEVVSLMGVVG